MIEINKVKSVTNKDLLSDVSEVSERSFTGSSVTILALKSNSEMINEKHIPSRNNDKNEPPIDLLYCSILETSKFSQMTSVGAGAFLILMILPLKTKKNIYFFEFLITQMWFMIIKKFIHFGKFVFFNYGIFF